MLDVSFPSAIPNSESQIQISQAQLERTGIAAHFHNSACPITFQPNLKPAVMKKLKTLALADL